MAKRRDTLPKSHRRVVGQPPPASGQPRRISRREKEERQRRQLFLGLSIAAGLILVVLAGFALNEYWFKPRHVLASVDGHDIRRRDYWKYRAVELSNQANQYIQIANSPFIEDSQRQQYVTLAQQTDAQVDEVWGSTDLNESTLQNMIDDQVYLRSIDQFGITITEQDVQDYIDQRFEPANAPIFTPTPSPTLIPERAEWATQTAIAFEQPEGATPVSNEATPLGSPSATSSAAMPIEHAGSPTVIEASPVAPESTPMIPSASPEASAASPVGATPVASATPMLSPTPNQEQARQTATATFGDYKDNVLDRAHMSRSDYVDLIVRPQIARERIGTQLTADVGQRAEQVHAEHILVDTKDLADAIYADLQNGADFAQAAKDQSIDSATAPNGGDLGWFTRGQMVDEFEQVAFSTAPGQISAPFETEFGWHIVKVIEHEQERPMTDDQISRLRQSRIDDWLASRKAELSISSEIKPTPTSTGPEQFVPPPDAPPPPTEPIELTVEAGSGTPDIVASPVPVGTPVAATSP